jgi:competence protein ComEC
VASKHYWEYLDVAVREEAEWLPARPGARLQLDEVELLVLGPQREEGRSPIRANDASLVIRLTVDGSFAYVNAGDAPAAEERRTLDRWPIDSLRADVLKVSHHGSKNSSDVGWLTAVAPELAIISAGAANRYGHPHPMTLARLDSAGIPAVWRTDRDGTACVTVDRSGRWWVERG